MHKKAQTGLVTAFISILVAVIVGVGVAIPVIQNTITNASLTGTTLTIVNLLPLMVGLVLFVAVAGLITLRQ
jgi:ABC-type nitrate/sulfonate/bicarbonate transport system permease component